MVRGDRAGAAKRRDKVVAEVDGALDLEVERGFRLTVRADRIDLCEDGSAVIYDYKTGKLPL